MARIPIGKNKDKVFSIKKWFGVNENPDGDIGLKPGEASTSTNFKVTDNGSSLQKRPGSQNVAGLMNSYTTATAETTTALKTDNQSASSTFTVYPTINVSDTGILSTSGSSATMNYANHETYDGYYCQDLIGNFYEFDDVVFTEAATGTHVTGGSVNIASTSVIFKIVSDFLNETTYSGLAVSSGNISLSGSTTTLVGSHQDHYGKYYMYNGLVYKIDKAVYESTNAGGNLYNWYGFPVTFAENDTYTWNFFRVTPSASTSDNIVRGIWSGYINGTEYIVAACNGHLWSLSIDVNGVWSKTDIGTLDTSKAVCFFGFSGILYIMNGTDYKYWDGTNYGDVIGYNPLVYVATPPAGGGTFLEQINKLNGLRRIWFSPNGTDAVFHLPETGLSSIDYVKNRVTDTNYTLTTHYTVNTTAGTVTFVSIPTAGVDTIEVGYTASSSYRTQVEAMRYAEVYNGVTDNRVFIYGDGSNQAFYSGLDYNGLGRADYFPDLNVAHMGDSSTGITSMVRHHDRLMAFKPDSAYSIAYDTITLPGGSVTAGFYVTSVNKMIGNIPLGQAQLADNNPRTLDGKSIYEWVATSSSGNVVNDQRNAQRISNKVQKTLKEIDFTKAITFFDKINHEYYVVEDGVAIVNNTSDDTWYVYRDFPATCMIVYKDEVYFGTSDGYIRHFSRDYMHDCGNAITCYWESGSMTFNAIYLRKFLVNSFVTLKPEQNGEIYATIQTDRMNDYSDMNVIANYTGEIQTGFFDFLNLNFDHFTFNLNDKPKPVPLKFGSKYFTTLKWIFSLVSNDTTTTVLEVENKIRYIGEAR